MCCVHDVSLDVCVVGPLSNIKRSCRHDDGHLRSYSCFHLQLFFSRAAVRRLSLSLSLSLSTRAPSGPTESLSLKFMSKEALSISEIYFVFAFATIRVHRILLLFFTIVEYGFLVLALGVSTDYCNISAVTGSVLLTSCY